MTPKVIFLLALVPGVLVERLTTPYMGIATFAYFLLLAGFTQRKINTKIHARFMLSGIALDLAVVLVLETQRSAINTALEFSLTLPQQLHIIFSSLALILYFPAAYIGFRRYNGQLTSARSLKVHKAVGVTALILRTAGFVLMFSLVNKYV